MYTYIVFSCTYSMIVDVYLRSSCGVTPGHMPARMDDLAAVVSLFACLHISDQCCPSRAAQYLSSDVSSFTNFLIYINIYIYIYIFLRTCDVYLHANTLPSRATEELPALHFADIYASTVADGRSV